MVPAVKKHFPGMQVVSLAEWVGQLREVNEDDQAEVATKPALKILDWFVELQRVLTSTQLHRDMRLI